ncbi:hypothetical protein WJ970_23630 [Achromobacter xylosoxidans]
MVGDGGLGLQVDHELLAGGDADGGAARGPLRARGAAAGQLLAFFRAETGKRGQGVLGIGLEAPAQFGLFGQGQQEAGRCRVGLEVIVYWRAEVLERRDGTHFARAVAVQRARQARLADMLAWLDQADFAGKVHVHGARLRRRNIERGDAGDQGVNLRIQELVQCVALDYRRQGRIAGRDVVHDLVIGLVVAAQILDQIVEAAIVKAAAAKSHLGDQANLPQDHVRAGVDGAPAQQHVGGLEGLHAGVGGVDPQVGAEPVQRRDAGPQLRAMPFAPRDRHGAVRRQHEDARVAIEHRGHAPAPPHVVQHGLGHLHVGVIARLAVVVERE